MRGKEKPMYPGSGYMGELALYSLVGYDQAIGSVSVDSIPKAASIAAVDMALGASAARAFRTKQPSNFWKNAEVLPTSSRSASE